MVILTNGNPGNLDESSVRDWGYIVNKLVGGFLSLSLREMREAGFPKVNAGPQQARQFELC